MTVQVSWEHGFHVSSENVWVFNPFFEKRTGRYQFGASYTISNGGGQPLDAESVSHLNLITDVANLDTAMYDDSEVA